MREAKVAGEDRRQLCIKVPLTLDGLKACKAIRSRRPHGQRHAVLLGQPGAAGRQGRRQLHLALHRPHRRHRHRRHGADRARSARSTTTTISRREILAASIRTVNHVKQAALIGADVATVPPATLKALVKHPLTDKGLENVPRRLEEDRAIDSSRAGPSSIMPARVREAHYRSIAKAVGSADHGSIDTLVPSWIITGSFKFTGSIASVEMLDKIGLYYFHERALSRPLGPARGRSDGRCSEPGPPAGRGIVNQGRLRFAPGGSDVRGERISRLRRRQACDRRRSSGSPISGMSGGSLRRL